MKAKITCKTGNFMTLGVIPKNDGAEFTFLSKDAPVICLYNKSDKKKLAEIPLEKKCKRGLVYSAIVSGFDSKNTLYSLKSLNKDICDRYSKEVIREKDRLYYGFSDDFQYVFQPLEKKEELFIYKAHLSGLTKDKNLSSSGTYKGIIPLIPKLKKLGINAMEFLPVYDFCDYSKDNKRNFWGYGDSAPYYFSPKSAYFGESPSDGVRSLVNALHKADIWVIIEFCVEEGIEGSLIVDAVKHWAFDFGIDGFRFIGKGVPKQALITDPFLSDTILIFEDIPCELIQETGDNLYVENDGFLYSLRRLINQTGGSLSEFVFSFLKQSENITNINYGASFNGFTLLDSFSYYDKHNEANGEDNQDGNNYNCSNNCGIEGPTRDKSITKKRLSKIRSTLLSVILSQGASLIVAGDEMLNSQGGNNNPYCQDNKTGWVNYSRKKDALLLTEYVGKIAEFKKKHLVLSEKKVFKMNDYLHLGLPDVSYHGKEPWSIGINEHDKSIGILFNGRYSDSKEDVMLLFNFNNDEACMALPNIPKKKWYLITNTGSFDFDEKGICLNKADKIKVDGGTISVLVAR